MVDKAKVRAGAEVAKSLGWPSDQTTALGAAGGLIDIGSDLRPPRSASALVGRYHSRSRARIGKRVAATALRQVRSPRRVRGR